MSSDSSCVLLARWDILHALYLVSSVMHQPARLYRIPASERESRSSPIMGDKGPSTSSGPSSRDLDSNVSSIVLLNALKKVNVPFLRCDAGVSDDACSRSKVVQDYDPPSDGSFSRQLISQLSLELDRLDRFGVQAAAIPVKNALKHLNSKIAWMDTTIAPHDVYLPLPCASFHSSDCPDRSKMSYARTSTISFEDVLSEPVKRFKVFQQRRLKMGT